jgi:hypothetical protein
VEEGARSCLVVGTSGEANAFVADGRTRREPTGKAKCNHLRGNAARSIALQSYEAKRQVKSAQSQAEISIAIALTTHFDAEFKPSAQYICELTIIKIINRL